MQYLKVIPKNNETILPICFYGKNRNEEVLEHHKKVMNHWNIPMNYLEIPFDKTGHGDAIQWIINQFLNQELPDYFWFCDMDCIPLRADFVDILYSKIRDKQSIFGPALATNHRPEIKNHIYAAAFCLSFSKQVYKDLGCPLMTDTIRRSDNSQELTWRAQEQGKIISFMWPTSHEDLTDEEMKETGNPRYFKLGEYHKYGMSTQYGDLIFHGFVQNIKRSNQNFINKCKEILTPKFEFKSQTNNGEGLYMGLKSGENPPQKVEAVIVCKNYSDYLAITLAENKKYFDNIIVVTDKLDWKTQAVCDENDAECLIYDGFNKNGAKFNKGGALNFGLSKLKYKDWVVILDSDIVIKEDFRQKLIDKNKFYGSYRRFIPNLRTYNQITDGRLSANSTIENLEKIEGSGCGFFQCFNVNNIYGRLRQEIMGNLYEDSYSAEKVDIDFLRIFCPLIEHDPNLVRMNIELWHLGPHGVNNEGRSEKDIFFNENN